MQRATSFSAGSAVKPTSSEKRCWAACGVIPSGRVISTCVPLRTLSSTKRISHLPCSWSCNERSRISFEWPFWSKSSIRRGRGVKTSFTARWFPLKAAQLGVQMGSLPFSFSSPATMRRHMCASHFSLLSFSQASLVAGMAGAPWLLPIQVKQVSVIMVYVIDSS